MVVLAELLVVIIQVLTEEPLLCPFHQLLYVLVVAVELLWVEMHLILVDQVVVLVINHQFQHLVERGQEILDILVQQTKHLHQMDGVIMVVPDMTIQLQIMPVVVAVVLQILALVQMVLNMPVLEVMEHHIQ
tara:strand:+ start:76 stop:471 length:396 start_codon:yes stop_codon:yes gene_type:complete